MPSENSNGVEPQKILAEIPEELKKLTLYLVKSFYGLEHFVLIYYLQRNTILKEEQIRDLCRIDQRNLRQLLITLKVEKFIRERIVSEEFDGRSRKSAYYFVNYKAVLNITKYKLDHIRQKLEVRDKDRVQSSSYFCTNESCKTHYDAIDVGKIYDPFTQEMRCWHCSSLVATNDGTELSTENRSSLAKFNEQVSPIFSMLKKFDGVKFSHDILEPPVPNHLTDSKREEFLAKPSASQRIVSTVGKTRAELYGGDIKVSIGEQSNVANSSDPLAKPNVPWLETDHSISKSNFSEGFDHHDGDMVKMRVLADHREKPPAKEPMPKPSRKDEIARLLSEIEGL